MYPSNEVSSPLFAPKLPAASFQELSSNPAAVQAVSEPSPAAGSVLLSRYFQLVLRLTTYWDVLSASVPSSA